MPQLLVCSLLDVYESLESLSERFRFLSLSDLPILKGSAKKDAISSYSSKVVVRSRLALILIAVEGHLATRHSPHPPSGAYSFGQHSPSTRPHHRATISPSPFAQGPATHLDTLPCVLKGSCVSMPENCCHPPTHAQES